MILTGAQIAEARANGKVWIEPFEPERCATNSYDFRLFPALCAIDGELDAARPSAAREIEIPEAGHVLRPGALYLGLTYELTGSARYAQLINGDRSLGSLGVWVHVTAPLGHMGHAIRWTLEIRAAKPVRVYPLMDFGKIVFAATRGAAQDYRAGTPKYAADEIATSRLYQEAATWVR